MKLSFDPRSLAAAAAALVLSATFAPSARASHSVSVDVWVQDRASYDGDVRIEFAPQREAYVALYAVFSDGSVAPVYPVARGRKHWVGHGHHFVNVRVPRGVYLETVQAYASCDWFDPWDCWQACAPQYSNDPWRSPCEVAVAYSYPVSAWSFSLHWDSGWNRPCHTGHRVRCDAPPRRLVATSGGRHSDWKWKSDAGRGGDARWNGDDRRDDGRRDDARRGTQESWRDRDGRGNERGETQAVVASKAGKQGKHSVNGKSKGRPESESSKSRRVSGEPKRGSRG